VRAVRLHRGEPLLHEPHWQAWSRGALQFLLQGENRVHLFRWCISVTPVQVHLVTSYTWTRTPVQVHLVMCYTWTCTPLPCTEQLHASAAIYLSMCSRDAPSPSSAYLNGSVRGVCLAYTQQGLSPHHWLRAHSTSGLSNSFEVEGPMLLSGGWTNKTPRKTHAT